MGFLDKMLGRSEAEAPDEVSAELEATVKELQKRLSDYDTESYLNYNTKLIDPTTSGPLNYYGSIQQDLDIATLQRLFTTEGWFYIVVSTIAKTIAALPIKLERKKVDTVDGAQTETWVDASGEPEARLFRHPNDIMTPFEFWWLVMVDLFSTGNAYLYIDKTAEGANPLARAQISTVQGMYRINPSMVEPIPGKNRVYVDGYMIKMGNDQIVLTPEQVLHIKFPNPIDPFVGLSSIVPVYKNVLIDRYSGEHMIRFYKQGARLGGVVTTAQKLSKDQLTRLQRGFEQDFTGRHNHHRTLVLPQGMEYKIVEQNPGETSLIEFQKANREPILSAFNVPPVKVGLLDGASYANALVQLKIYYTDTIMPPISLIEQSLNAHPSILRPDRQLRARYDLSQVEVLRENDKEVTMSAKAGLESGLTVNESRQRFWKLPPIDGGDVCPAVEKASQSYDLNNPTAPGLPNAVAPALPGAKPTAPVAGVPVVDPSQQPDQSQQEAAIVNQVALNGAQVAAMLDVVNRVAVGELPRESGVAMLIGAFGLTEQSAQAIMGEVGRGFRITRDPATGQPVNPPAPPKAAKEVAIQPDANAIGSDVKPTGISYSQRVAQLTAIYVEQGMLPETAALRAQEQAQLEGFDPALPDEVKEVVTAPETIPTAVGTKPITSNDVGKEAGPIDSRDGRHVHIYEASAAQTAVDGKHKHGWKQADGTILWSEESGDHQHEIDIDADTEISGAHKHVVKYDSAGTVIEIESGGEHTHEYLPAQTTLSGEHVHTLKLPDGTEITSLTAGDLESIGKENANGKESKEEASQKETQEGLRLKNPFTKDQLDAHWKQMSEAGLETLFEKRATEAREFLSRLGKLYQKKFEKNLRKFGVSFKAADDEDIISEETLNEFLDAEASKLVDGSLKDSSKYGFEKNLIEFKMNYPDTYAQEVLAETAATNVKYVSDSVKEDMRSIFKTATDEPTSVTQIGNQLRDYFGDEMSKGRVERIARTETLQAVSIGQDTKTQEFKKEFPDESKNLRKIWITSRDDRVRGNPDGLYPAKSPLDADHFSLDTQVRDYDEAFDNGLQYPREKGGEAQEVINCRCAWMTFLASEQSTIEDIVAEGSPAADVGDGPQEVKCITLPEKRWGRVGDTK